MTDIKTSSCAKPRIPEAINGIQVNFCKNPVCRNYGRPASLLPQAKGRPTAGKPITDTYIIGSSSEHTAFMTCKLCGEHPPIKSNLAIHEELSRMVDYLSVPPEHSCPVTVCSNHGLSLETSGAYYRTGKTDSGAQRYRCRACRKTFSVATSSVRRQRKPEVNETVFRLLVNKIPLKRICETAGITISTLYGKIDFIHRQCVAFAAEQERKIPDLPLNRLYLAVDRQDYLVNWRQANDKRNVLLHALGCADNRSSYVFGVQVNFDPSLDSVAVNEAARECGDMTAKPAFRHFARVWLDQDYQQAKGNGKKSDPTGKALGETIQEVYREAAARPDIEEFDAPTLDFRLPHQGMQVHAEYTLYGYFFFLQKLLCNVDKVRFYLDQESGIRAACLAAFQQEVLDKRCDAFYVRINKDLTVNDKRKRKADGQKQLEELRDSDPVLALLADHELRLLVIKERLQDLVKIGQWQDKWLFYPFPDMSEPEKAICWLTDLQDQAYDTDHLARLYSKATLHGIDRFFMQARRRLSLLERPIATSSNVGRKWYGYSPYNPDIVGKLLTIFRIFYNYVAIGEDKLTPAMRIGLTEKTITLEEILLSGV